MGLRQIKIRSRKPRKRRPPKPGHSLMSKDTGDSMMKTWARGIYWAMLLMVYGVVFVGFSGQIQSVAFFNLIITLGGQLTYFQTVFGVLILLLIIMTLDLMWR